MDNKNLTFTVDFFLLLNTITHCVCWKYVYDITFYILKIIIKDKCTAKAKKKINKNDERKETTKIEYSVDSEISFKKQIKSQSIEYLLNTMTSYITLLIIGKLIK